jgi:WS/DGAT/MGAT family acyltransferase
MPRYTYERLSAQDNSFLLMETPTVYMHVAGTQIFEAGPLRNREGGIDITAVKRSIESVLHLIPRYRQKLKWIPYENHPVWVDDRRFSLDYHIRHTALPRPGNDEQLKRLAARIMAQLLDRTKPLWEYWVVEGLQGDRFAVVSKIHHCMIDGASGADLAQILMSLTPDRELPDVLPYIPRPAPSGSELFRDEWGRRVSLPLAAVRSFREFNQHTEDLRYEVVKRAKALASLVPYAIRSASETPLNGRLGPHRRVDWLTMPLAEVKAVRRALGCTVNDIVLTTVAGAVRDYLTRRRVNPDPLDFRVSAPVSVRRDADHGTLGNKVSSWIIQLPIDRADPIERLEAIYQVTQKLKKSEQALGVEMLMAAAEWAPSVLLSLGSQATSGPINMIVTNVPGPQVPLYMLGSKLLEMFPQVPLLENTGLGVALFSYDGSLFWGFNADPELVPDLAAFVSAISKSFKQLKETASVRSASARPVAAALKLAVAETPPLEAVSARNRSRPRRARRKKAAANTSEHLS